ncbi:MAG: hypothetical protein WBA29_18865 [Xanthobacteraceae bacterium]
MAMTAQEITAIIGPADEQLLSEIMLTGATAEELAQAWAWVNSDDVLIDAGQPLPGGKIAELIDLLELIDDQPDR